MSYVKECTRHIAVVSIAIKDMLVDYGKGNDLVAVPR